MNVNLKYGKLIAAALFALFTPSLSAHSSAETNELVSAMLGNVLFFASDNWADNAGISTREAPVTWPGFLGRDESHGWTLAEKKAAFDWYLSTLGTNDCTALRGEQRHYVGIAVNQCRVLNYTEAVSPLKALALNPKGICRKDAIELVIKFSPVDDVTTAFTESIMTNSIGYAIRERGTASCQYAEKLLYFNAMNESQRTVVTNAVAMFYKNRMLEPNAFPIVDSLFVKYIDNYSISSNRLEHALNALSLPDCGSVTKRRFAAVTNQLLSSGQPLPWIDVGGNGN